MAKQLAYNPLTGKLDFIDPLALSVRSAQVGTVIDMEGDGIKFMTLSGNTTFTISNPSLAAMVILELTGAFTVTLPGTVVVINGDYCPALGKNYLFLFCNDESTPEYLASWGVTI